MRSTEILQDEHRVIEQVLNCLEKMADQALVAGKLDESSAREALDFFQTFADGCHHHKEEDYLFPLMEARGFPRQGGPTGVMLHEHEEGRMHIRAMQAALAGAGAGRRPDIQTFAAHARAYVELLRSHIIKEDQRLFPMANQVFSPEDQAQLLKQFTYAEHHDLGAGTHEKYLQLAEGLAERFHVPRASTVGCGCSHGKREQTGQLCPAEELPNCQPDDSGELGVGD